MQRVEEATKTVEATVAGEEATETVDTVAGLEPSQLVEEATKTVATVAGLELRRRDEATTCRARTPQESSVRIPSITLPDPCPPTFSVPEAGALLGIGERKSYELARVGDFPTPVLRLGHQLRVPTRPLLRLLGLLDEPESGETSERTGPIAAAQDQEARQSA